MDSPVATVPESQTPSFWSDVREAIAGSARDYTDGSIGRAITMLAIPMVLEMCMESLFGLVDVFFVASLGKYAAATVGITESMLTILFAIAMGLSMAATATIARRIGEKQPEAAAVAAVQIIGAGVVIAACFGVFGGFAAPLLLRLMGADAEMIEKGTAYTAIIFGGSVTVFLLFLINAVFRGAGDAAIAMRTLWLANIINIVLDPCLIFGWGPFPEMGLTGAAVATTIGRATGVVYQFAMLIRGRGRLTIGREHIRFEWPVLRTMLRVSLNGMFQYLIATASWVALVRMVALFGSAAVAGYTIAIRLLIFAILPSWGMSNAAATLVGQNLGAGKPDRAERSVYRAGFYNMIFLGLVAIVFISFAEMIVRQFTDQPEVLRIAVQCLRLVSYGYVFYAWGMVMEQAFNGAGDTATPTIINLFCYWLFQIPLAYSLAIWGGFGERGVFLAITIAESLLAVVALLAFRRGKWKRQKI
jgi:putative MATE family efflux protein